MELIRKNIYLIKNKIIFSSNTYIYFRKSNNECIIIDPGFDTELIDSEILQNNLIPIAIISTHGHFDHIASAAFLKNKYKVPYYLHEADLKIAKSANFYLKVAQLNYKIETPIPDYLFKGEHENLTIKGFDLDIYNLPGHSPGSCVVKIENFLFSGDLIYKNGLGAVSIPKEDLALLKRSILIFFNMFNSEEFLLPGHGAPEYLKWVKKNNSKLKDFLFQNNERNEI